MKCFFKVFTLFSLSLISCFSLQAQSPEGVNYQALIRNNSGEVLSGESVSVRFTIHQSNASGTTVFQETHAATTNQFGLVNLVIGSVNTTGFPLINWSTGIYFLQIEVDNGAGFDDLGATQLMSVPYALYAATSGTGAPGLNSLLDTNSVLSVICANGGKRILMGLDANSNGNLELTEITSSFVVCNGLDGLSINWMGNSQPTTPSTNDAYYNATDGVSYIYNGTTTVWDTLAAGGSGSADSDWVVNSNEMYANPGITGHVGIGTSSPLKRFHIESSFAGGDGILINSNTAAGDPGIEFQTQGASQFVLGVDQSDNNKFKIGTSDVEVSTRLTINNLGQVGIGNTSPGALLDVGYSTNTFTIRGVNTNTTNGVAGYFKNTVLTNTNAALFVKVASTTAPAVTLSTLSSTTLRMERTNASAFDWELTANNTGFHIRGGANGTGTGLTDFMTIDGNGSVGLGTTTPNPLAKLHIAEEGQTIVAIQSSHNGAADESGMLSFLKSRGTITAPTSVLSGDQLGKLEFLGWDGSNWSEAASINAISSENFTTGGRGTHVEFHTTPIGSTSSFEVMRLLDNGNVGIGTSVPTSTLTIEGSVAKKMEFVTSGTMITLDENTSGVIYDGITTFVVNLPDATTCNGRIYHFSNIKSGGGINLQAASGNLIFLTNPTGQNLEQINSTLGGCTLISANGDWFVINKW